MIDKIIIEPMTEDFIVWRCLHGGPLSRETIDRRSSSDIMSFDHYRERNTSLLEKITRIYGACAIIARDSEEIVGQLRFYPKAICNLEGAGGMCLQQNPAAGPAEDFVDIYFPPPSQIKDKTLVVHCMMTGSSLQKENPYQRKGIGSRMVRVLIEWAKANDWERIEADSFEDLPIIYEITGSTGHTFWKKLGFKLVNRHPHPELHDRSQNSEFITTLEEQAKSIGIPPERAKHRLVMRLDLKCT
jgi:GNAT superfamily N-acetyltransferase